MMKSQKKESDRKKNVSKSVKRPSKSVSNIPSSVTQSSLSHKNTKRESGERKDGQILNKKTERRRSELVEEKNSRSSARALADSRDSEMDVDDGDDDDDDPGDELMEFESAYFDKQEKKKASVEKERSKKTQKKDNETKKTAKKSKSDTTDGKKTPNKIKLSSATKERSAVGVNGSGEKTSVKRKLTTAEDEKEVKSKKAKLDEATFKERKNLRKMTNKNYEIGKKAKGLWEQLRRFDLKPDKRQKICEELYVLVKGRMKTLIFAHDTSRVIQSLVKYGSKEHRNAIFVEIKDKIIDIIKSKYAKFFIKKVLKYGGKDQREHVFKQLNGHFKKLLKHKEAGELIEIIYNYFANATQRSAITEEFYGKAYTITKTADAKTLNDVIKANPEKRELLLDSLKKSLDGLVTKSVLQFSLVHHLFHEFFLNADDTMRTDMIENVREGLVHMLHTRDGSRIAMTCLWYGTAKDRKVIVKSFKTYVVKICKEEHGHHVMLALFDVVDDTKLVQKAILEELLQSVDELVSDTFGRKVLFYLLTPRDPHHFHPDVVSVLQKGDGNANSKKDPELRRQELRQFVSKPLLQWIYDHRTDIVADNSLLTLMTSIIKHAKSDPTAAMTAIVELLVEPYSAAGKESFSFVDDTAGHLALKQLILNDKERMNSGENELFSSFILDKVSSETLVSWTKCNRGCFILVSMFETENEDIVKQLSSILDKCTSKLKKETFAGAKVLLKKLSN